MILLLVLSLLFPFQEKSDQFKQEISGFRNKGKFSVTYDKFTDHTRVTVGPFLVSGIDLSMHGRFAYTRNERDVKEFFLIFQASGRRWTLLNNRRVHALIGEERFDLGEGHHTGNVRYGGVSESLVVIVPAEMFQKIANAPSAFRVGIYEVTLKDEHQEAFRDLYKLSRASR